MPKPQIVAELIIRMDDTGNVSVSGPMENRMLIYGLLEVTRDTIVEFHAAAKKNIVQAPPGLANALKLHNPGGN